jgi:hypothetical protein
MACSIVVVLFGLLGAGAAPNPHVSQSFRSVVTHVPVHAPGTVQLGAVVRGINPHLHIASQAPATRAHEPAAAHNLVIIHRHRAWHYHWSYHAWAVRHHGLGAIAGIVYDASGRPVPGARVVLKRPGGKYFANVHKRHATHTNASGAFVMKGVHAGRYRVVAHKAKARGHVQSSVATGNVSAVTIRI